MNETVVINAHIGITYDTDQITNIYNSRTHTGKPQKSTCCFILFKRFYR